MVTIQTVMHKTMKIPARLKKKPTAQSENARAQANIIAAEIPDKDSRSYFFASMRVIYSSHLPFRNCVPIKASTAEVTRNTANITKSAF